jgi:phosphoserine phosphatase
MFTATLVAECGLAEIFDEIAHQFESDFMAGKLLSLEWIEEDVAGDLVFAPMADLTAADCAVLADTLQDHCVAIAKGGLGLDLKLDVVVQPAAGRRKRLLAADMDSTIITVECIDELADYAGVKAQVADVTERAMRGEVEFEAALRERVALLAGLDQKVLARCLAERVRLTPGAETLVRTMSREGAQCLLVSGGFTFFADAVAEQAGFHRAVSNRLGTADGRLTGTVEGSIVGAAEKRRALIEFAAESGVDLTDALAIGDGANDIPMLQAAGLGVAYHAKPAAVAAAGARIRHGDLSTLLYAQGYPRKDWVGEA